MTASFAPSGRPTWAITCWADDVAVYVELPCKDGPPYITKYALTEAGLSKALSLMRELHRKAQPAGSSYSAPIHPKTKYDAKGEFTKDQRASARNVLKRLKII